MRKHKSKQPIVLLESSSPVCQLKALVEDNGDSVYFYLYGQAQQERFMRSCWVCNKVAAPKEIDQKAMQNGRAPKMPMDCCDHPQGMEAPQKLEIVWFEEGDAAALLSDGQMLAVIPGWAEPGEFPGYSRHSTQCNQLAWPLSAEAEKNLMKQVDAGKDWGAYLEGDFWQEFQPQHLAAVERFFGAHKRYFGIDGGEFPPKALVTYRKGNIHYAVTLGVSLFPMPKIEQVTPAPSRRMELAFAWEEGSPIGNEMSVFGYLSSISRIPWENITFLGNGHTVPCNSIPGFCAVLLCCSEEQELRLPNFRGDKVEVLWAIPLTDDEYAFAVNNSSAALLEKTGAGNGLCVFTGKAKFLRGLG